MPIVYAMANIGLWIVHIAVIVLNCVGWTHPKTRRFSLWLLVFTLVGWVGLGLVFGLGYCVLTDIHWRVRENMGIYDNPSGFFQLLIRELTGSLPSDAFVMGLAVGGAMVGAIGHIAMACIRRDLTTESREVETKLP